MNNSINIKVLSAFLSVLIFLSVFVISTFAESFECDINRDGDINLTDASTLLKHIAGWEVGIDENEADVNEDGKVNLSDVSFVLKYIAGWDLSDYKNDPYYKIPVMEEFSSDVIEKRKNPFANVVSATLYKNGKVTKFDANDPRIIRLLNFMTFSDEDPIQSYYILGGFLDKGDYEYAAGNSFRLELCFDHTYDSGDSYITLSEFDRAIITEDTVYLIMTPDQSLPNHIGWIKEYSIICTGWFPYQKHFAKTNVKFDILAYAGF